VPEELDPTLKDVDFSRAAAIASYGEGGAMPEERWVRANKEIRFEDVISELTGLAFVGRAISCPFHGTDSRPSFYVYPGGNDGYCFGCSLYYDNVIFASKFLQFSRVKALKWLEHQFELPPMADIILEKEEDDDEEEVITLEFGDLSEHYIQFAMRDIQEVGEADQAEEYLRIYFEAEKEKLVLPLGRVLGQPRVKKILQRKASR
jgi:DNA primase